MITSSFKHTVIALLSAGMFTAAGCEQTNTDGVFEPLAPEIIDNESADASSDIEHDQQDDIERNDAGMINDEIPEKLDVAEMKGLEFEADSSGSITLNSGYTEGSAGVGSGDIGCVTGTCQWGQSAIYSFIAGNANHVMEDYGIALGQGNIVYNDATSGSALGSKNEVRGNYATAIGRYNDADGVYSTAVGYSCDATGKYSTAIGYGAAANGQGSVAINGMDVSGENSVGIKLNGPQYRGRDCAQDNSMCIMGGNVGIGTSQPDKTLTVNGVIKAEEIQVVQDVIADYVFAPDYNLMPLSEVEKFVKKHKHLPGIKSEAEVKAEGNIVSIGESYNKLLEKIEELTLHTIALEKEVTELKKKNARQ
ncbi:MAG: hypothetical protein JXR76_21870 [Deltaproteobacteria bacterium]|nr:hypothetical protein [Deltaproteobacteria bacterium]